MNYLDMYKRPSPTALLNPRLDPNFKAIFTQETATSYTALKSFLTSILGRNISKVQLTSNEPPVDTPDQMQMKFDVSVIFEDGERASIEMQGRDRKYSFATRSEIQVARLLNNNAKQGDNWEAEKVYQISVLNFHLPKDDKCEMSWYTMKNQMGQVLSGHLNVIYIDLLEIRKLYKKPVEKLTGLQKWGLYFSYADDESKADYIKKIVASEEGIMAANLIVEKMSEEDENWFRQNSYDTARRDYNSEMQYYRKEGLEQGIREGRRQGIQQGIQQKSIEAAKNLYANGVSIEIIAKSLAMTEDDIKKIIEEK